MIDVGCSWNSAIDLVTFKSQVKINSINTKMKEKAVERERLPVEHQHSDIQETVNRITYFIKVDSLKLFQNMNIFILSSIMETFGH